MKRFFFLALFCGAFFSGCIRQNVPVQFDTSDPLALNPEIQWAVVIEPYAAIYEDADYASVVVTHFRKGEILQITGERTVKTDEGVETWYAFDEGWMPSVTITVYSNKMRAQTAVSQMGVR